MVARAVAPPRGLDLRRRSPRPPWRPPSCCTRIDPRPAGLGPGDRGRGGAGGAGARRGGGDRPRASAEPGGRDRRRHRPAARRRRVPGRLGVRGRRRRGRGRRMGRAAVPGRTGSSSSARWRSSCCSSRTAARSARGGGRRSSSRSRRPSPSAGAALVRDDVFDAPYASVPPPLGLVSGTAAGVADGRRAARADRRARPRRRLDDPALPPLARGRADPDEVAGRRGGAAARGHRRGHGRRAGQRRADPHHLHPVRGRLRRARRRGRRGHAAARALRRRPGHQPHDRVGRADPGAGGRRGGARPAGGRPPRGRVDGRRGGRRRRRGPRVRSAAPPPAARGGPPLRPRPRPGGGAGRGLRRADPRRARPRPRASRACCARSSAIPGCACWSGCPGPGPTPASTAPPRRPRRRARAPPSPPSGAATRRWPWWSTTRGWTSGPGLLADVLRAAALPVEVARLRGELRRRLEEVEESRARIVRAGDEERRRLERDLHDGAQQRLVALGMALRRVQRRVAGDPEAARALDGAVDERGGGRPGPARDRPRPAARGCSTTASGRRWPTWPAARRWPWTSTPPRTGRRPRSRRPPTTWSPRRSRTRSSTRRRRA